MLIIWQKIPQNLSAQAQKFWISLGVRSPCLHSCCAGTESYFLKKEINNNHKLFKKLTAFILGLLHNHGEKIKQANPIIIAVTQRVEMNPPMHICLCL